VNKPTYIKDRTRDALIQDIELIHAILKAYMIQNNLKEIEALPPGDELPDDMPIGLSIVGRPRGDGKMNLAIKLIKGH
jgi:hypothetical protein